MRTGEKGYEKKYNKTKQNLNIQYCTNSVKCIASSLLIRIYVISLITSHTHHKSPVCVLVCVGWNSMNAKAFLAHMNKMPWQLIQNVGITEKLLSAIVVKLQQSADHIYIVLTK